MESTKVLRGIVSLFSLFSLCFTLGAASLQIDDEKLLGTLAQGKWVVLSLVADSEKAPSVTEQGRAYRKMLEECVQKQGGEVFTLSLNERKQWEQLWSSPFKARISQSLKDQAQQEGVNILTGSYPENKPQALTLNSYDSQKKKSTVYYAGAKKQTQVASADKVVKKEEASSNKVELSVNTLSFNRVEPSRQRPEGRERRRRRSSIESGDLKKLEARLKANPVLKDFSKSYENKSSVEVSKDLEYYIRQSERSWVASTKIEMLSRAYILMDRSGSSPEKVNELLKKLQKHEDFYNETRD
ncbi:MAG: hypothetical protein HQL32_08920 [Planctomycetes bacterium]|nr:hypothetical protein [Planctomycetota bacterium]